MCIETMRLTIDMYMANFTLQIFKAKLFLTITCATLLTVPNSFLPSDNGSLTVILVAIFRY